MIHIYIYVCVHSAWRLIILTSSFLSASICCMRIIGCYPTRKYPACKFLSCLSCQGQKTSFGKLKERSSIYKHAAQLEETQQKMGSNNVRPRLHNRKCKRQLNCMRALSG